MGDHDRQDDGSLKSYEQILDQKIEQGAREVERPTLGLLLSGLSAGLDVGFSLFLMATVGTVASRYFSEGVEQLLMSQAYTVGFIFVVIGRSELFTEHTTLAALPVLAGRDPLRGLVRLWGIVYLANLVGATLFAVLASWIGPELGVIDPEVFLHIARPLYEPSALVLFGAGALAGWLMGLLSWLVGAGRETISHIAIVWLITAIIGFAHLPHCIAGTVEVLAAVFAGVGAGLGDYGHFLVWSTLGNTAGGVVFVAVLKYGHVRPPRLVREDGVRPRLGAPPRARRRKR